MPPYNLLPERLPDGILYNTMGQRTFPWYLQEVGGVRQDVRVVNRVWST